MWNRYTLEIEFADKLMGGVPKHPNVIRSWLEARMPSEAAFAKMENPTPLPDLAEQVADEVGAIAPEENKVWCGFKDDLVGLYVDGYHVKAHLKDAANTLQQYTAIKALKAKVANRVFVEQDRLYLGVKEPTGYWEHPVHVLTMQGPRSALKRSDYVERARITVTLRVLDDGVLTEKLLGDLLDFGSVRGFGAERGLGFGRYLYTLTHLDSTGPAPPPEAA